MSTSLIKISVRHLVGFVLRSGDLGGSGFASSNRLVEGTRGHQRIQKSRPEGYQVEVPVSHRIEVEGLGLEINGRIDGLMEDKGQIVVEEIKTTESELDPDRPDNAAHWAQAKVYAYILAAQNGLDEVSIQLTYVQLGTFETLEDRRRFGAEELDQFFGDLVERYLEWARVYHEWCPVRDQSIDAVDFPYPQYRPGQRDLAVAAYRTIEARGRLFAQAPTGIGKTVSSLFPTIKAMGQGHVEKIFYLTAKTVGRTVAEKALEDLRRGGLRLKSLTLTARDKICFNPMGGKSCDPEQCEFAIGYYDRVNDALKAIFEEDDFTRRRIEEVARQYRVCPFEFSLDLSLWADTIICDYNYVFDPRAYLKRFFLDNSGDYVFLIDEAHNLVDRGREMFSARLDRLTVLGLGPRVKADHAALGRRLERINACMRDMGKRCGEGEEGREGAHWVDREAPYRLVDLVERFTDEAEQVLARNVPSPYYDDLVELYFEALAFGRIAELYDERYVTYVEKEGRDVQVRLFCLDPSELIRQALKRGIAAVFFSATLTPLPYFREILGGEEEDRILGLDSPFPRRHLHLLVADHIGTTYKARQYSYGDVAEAIGAAAGQRRGNYLAYFPSYRYMEEVAERFGQSHPGIETLVQRSGMSEGEREDFLAVFAADNDETMVGFAVMGGIFGEGIDLVGERLVGAFVVGVGLPQMGLERDLIRAYFDEQGRDGFEYAYTFPGMNRVLQAAGRVIRSAADKGVVLLIDQRFGQRRYQRLFPPFWQSAIRAQSAEGVGRAVEVFWRQVE